MNISPIPGILSKKNSIVEESNVGLIYFGIILILSESLSSKSAH